MKTLPRYEQRGDGWGWDIESPVHFWPGVHRMDLPLYKGYSSWQVVLFIQHLCCQCLNDHFLWVKPCDSKDFLLLLFWKCYNILFVSHTLSTFINIFFSLFISPIKQSCLFPAMVLTNPVTIQVFWYVFRSKLNAQNDKVTTISAENNLH